SSYALTNFDVQYWNGSAWAAVPGGAVTGNDKVWRKFTFASLTTSKIRVNVTNVAGDNHTQIVEVEAWTATSGSSSAQTHWLVTDQLGTPRMIFDQSGSFANVKRHDYLPFGEELMAGVSGRSASEGYGGGDGVRQQFTSKERDIEIGLDYFLARYYSSTQGRFTGVDCYDVNLERQQAQNEREAQSLLIKFIRNPQRWNHYSYGLNNPVKYVDPNGQQPQDSLELNFERDVKALMSHQITEDEFRSRMNARGVGAAVGMAILAVAYIGWEAGMTVLVYASTHPEQVEQVTMDLTMASTGSPAPGNPGTLTLSGTTRLTVQEAASGARVAAQVGANFIESPHVGAEIVGTTGNYIGKSIDLMGVPEAFVSRNWGNGAKFFDSILHHVNKSVDYVAIDLTGATKSQITAIRTYVSSLTKEQQAKIIYVR
ncbi:MAG TPA: RHS repeat-associated core domain-containing protein, partial [Pyrinomonadaceae bacterium]